eukprot:CAMPEP_0119029450 /NCGR_PEP_ID=MMETSP1176-20130426/40524_1 /TAXON_ID=265551 /ORGANISM="Synedropsis recta cf, Strain CCMP1620" /LENGTH=132 /DNA_ID=CAMNT_0006985793 /DNA_START=413 /DNA_END=811 /DNA_ORIENTATION=-
MMFPPTTANGALEDNYKKHECHQQIEKTKNEKCMLDHGDSSSFPVVSNIAQCISIKGKKALLSIIDGPRRRRRSKNRKQSFHFQHHTDSLVLIQRAAQNTTFKPRQRHPLLVDSSATSTVTTMQQSWEDDES